MNKVHFNPVSGASFSGRNLQAVEAAAKEHGYKSPKWITYFQASQLELLDGASLKGKAVGMIRFAKENGKSTPKWYNVFNTEEFGKLPKAIVNAKAPKPSKKAKAAPKKAAKKAATKTAKQSPAVSDLVAIPVQGVEGAYLIQAPDGTYTQITL